MAVQHGRIAAHNMLNPSAPKPVRTVPFFWTTQFRSLRYAGYCPPDAIEETILHGTPDKFVAYLVCDGQVRVVEGMVLLAAPHPPTRLVCRCAPWRR